MLLSEDSCLAIMDVNANEPTNNILKASAQFRLASFQNGMDLLKLVDAFHDMDIFDCKTIIPKKECH